MSFYKVVSELTDQAPELILRKLPEPKLRVAGVKAWRSGAKALAKHLADEQVGEFHWEDYPDGGATDVKVEFTEDDGLELERLYDKFEGTLEEAIAKVIDTSVDGMLYATARNGRHIGGVKSGSLQIFETGLRIDGEKLWMVSACCSIFARMKVRSTLPV